MDADTERLQLGQSVNRPRTERVVKGEQQDTGAACDVSASQSKA